jgi:hypothetical protein
MEVFQVTRQSQNQAVPVAEKDGRNTVKSKELVNGKVTCFTHAINSALNQKWQALDELESELEILEARLEYEKKFIFFFTQGQSNDVVALNVCGTSIFTTYQMLNAYARKQLSHQAS